MQAWKGHLQHLLPGGQLNHCDLQLAKVGSQGQVVAGGEVCSQVQAACLLSTRRLWLPEGMVNAVLQPQVSLYVWLMENGVVWRVPLLRCPMPDRLLQALQVA